jgi:NAD(P)H-dependent FMN reductase
MHASVAGAMLKLHVVIASTRPQRVGSSVGRWFFERAREHGKFEVTLVELEEQHLPLIDEPKHPRFRQYTQEHTKAWSAVVSAADAFVFVTPEYNYGPPPALLNAIDYLFFEWAYKPAGFVSYGGVSGGTRSAQMTKQVLTTLKVMPLPESVIIPFVAQHVEATEEGQRFKGGAAFEQSATAMLDELHRWTSALKTLRS